MTGPNGMSGEEWLALSAVVAAVITAIGAYAASRRASKRMAKLEERKLDGEEYDRSRAITDGIIRTLREEVDRLKAQVRELLDIIDQQQTENEALRRLVRDLTSTANTLRHQVRVLQQKMGV